MKCKKIILLIIILIMVGYGSNNPIIFIHGHESDPRPAVAWNTWDNVHSAMWKILNEGYRVYSAGSPLKCDKDSTPRPTGCETPKIYNFSYYHPDGNPGVISLSEESVRVYFAHVYDGLGRKIDFITTSPPASYDSTGYWSRCVPGVYWDTIDGVPRLRAKDVTRDYVRSWKVGKFAKRLAYFIDKVLAATGASKVDLVCHSMGGLVVRAAMKHYNTTSGEPVKNRIRKLLLIATPDKGVHSCRIKTGD